MPYYRFIGNMHTDWLRNRLCLLRPFHKHLISIDVVEITSYLRVHLVSPSSFYRRYLIFNFNSPEVKFKCFS